MSDWTPGRWRAARKLEQPYPGVPEHLYEPLFDWCVASFANQPGFLKVATLEMRLPGGLQLHEFLAEFVNEEDTFLDLVEYLLERRCAVMVEGRELEAAPALNFILHKANSLYRVTKFSNGLERRTIPEVGKQVQATVDLATGSPGEHLATAWNLAYARTPDPRRSYIESVMAVEAAFWDVVSPKNAKQRLGTMIRDISHKPTKWQFVLEGDHVTGVETVVAMMQVLWEHQTRHATGEERTPIESPEEARAAVHLAATLVQYGVSGAFRPVPTENQ